MDKELKIGLFGFGVVGQGLYDIFTQTSFPAEIIKICVKTRNKPRPIAMDYFTFEKEDLLAHEDINLIVEMIDNAEEAYEIVKTALKRGKNVVTANKKMVAEHLPELISLQKGYGVALLYEASVCGSIPIIRNLAEYYDNEMLHSVSGIFNGSSNYILTKVIQEKMSYDAALKEAQDLGFAETDPTLDVGGFDPKYKLCIVTSHAYGVLIEPEEVFNYGIEKLSLHDAEYANEKDLKIKLLATVEKVSQNEISLFVMPYLIPHSHSLYHVEYEYNGVIVEGAFSEKQVFTGKGAGGHPTGSAVLSDISARRYNYKYEYKKTKWKSKFTVTNDKLMEVYIRYHDEKDLKLFKLQDVDIKYVGRNYNYVIATINLMDLISIRKELDKRNVFVANTGRLTPVLSQTDSEESQIVLSEAE